MPEDSAQILRVLAQISRVLGQILRELDWNTFIGLLIGAGITYFFSIQKDNKKREQTKEDFQRGLCSQFRELRLRLANTCYQEMVEIGGVNQVNLQRLCNNLVDIQGNKDVERWRELAEMTDDKLTNIDEIVSGKLHPKMVNKFRVPALEAGISSLHLLGANHQQSIFSVMTKFDWLNEDIEKYQYFLEMQMQNEPVGKTEKWIRRRINVAHVIAGRALNILDQITETLKELSGDTELKNTGRS